MKNYPIYKITNRETEYVCTVALRDSVMENIAQNERYYDEGFYVTERDIKTIVELYPEYNEQLSELYQNNTDLIICNPS